MGKKKKKRNLSPRRLCMKRSGRLRSAVNWLAKFKGKHVARAYSNWYGVDRLCAVIELQILGVELDPKYVSAVKITCGTRKYKKSKQTNQEDPYEYGLAFQSDLNFAFIAGETSGGMPFGITWEEWREMGLDDID